MAKVSFLVISPHYICLKIGFWQCSENVAFSILLLSTKKSTPVFWKRFSFFRKFISKLKYWKRLNFPVIVTQKDVDLPNGGLFLKSLESLFRRTYDFSVGFKMKPIRKNFSLCEYKNQLRFYLKTCWNEQPFIFCL